MKVVLHIVNSRKFHVSTINKKKPTNLIIKMNLCYGKIGRTWQNKTKMKKKERKQREDREGGERKSERWGRHHEGDRRRL